MLFLTQAPRAVAEPFYRIKDPVTTLAKAIDIGLFKPQLKHSSLRLQPILSQPVFDLIEKRVMNLADYEAEDPFYIANMAQVVRQHAEWKKLLPRVEPHYAVKCNPDPMVISTLFNAGTGFDCASRAEIQLALDAGISPSKIIFANPCKQISHIRFAASKGVMMMTFDNEDELYKVKEHHPHAKMVLRILTDDSKSICRFGIKFGASLDVVPNLLNVAKEIGVDVVGIRYLSNNPVSMSAAAASMRLHSKTRSFWPVLHSTLVRNLDLNSSFWISAAASLVGLNLVFNFLKLHISYGQLLMIYSHPTSASLLSLDDTLYRMHTRSSSTLLHDVWCPARIKTMHSCTT